VETDYNRSFHSYHRNKGGKVTIFSQQQKTEIGDANVLLLLLPAILLYPLSNYQLTIFIFHISYYALSSQNSIWR